MELSIYELIGIAIYFWIAGINAEFMHNYTCNLFMSVLMSLFWPITGWFGPKDRTRIPKYYEEMNKNK